MRIAPIRRAPTGHRIGESHPRAKLSDARVEHLRTLHDAGIGYKRAAKIIGCPVSTARDICTYRTR